MSDHIDASVSLKKLIKGLDFVDEETAEAARTLPQLFLEAGRYHVKKRRFYNRVKSELELLRAKKGHSVRGKIADSGERVTEGRVAEVLGKDEKIQELEASLRGAEEEEMYAKVLFEAFRIKRDMLKVVADLLGAEIYVSRKLEGEPTELNRIKNKLKDKYKDKDHD